jgi:hypothetical protein
VKATTYSPTNRFIDAMSTKIGQAERSYSLSVSRLFRTLAESAGCGAFGNTSLQDVLLLYVRKIGRKALADFVPERKRLVEMGQDPDYESANKSEYGWTEPTRWATPKDRPAFSTPLSTGF